MDQGENGPRSSTLRGYARRRGVSATSVIRRSVVTDGNGTPQIADVVADQDWGSDR